MIETLRTADGIAYVYNGKPYEARSGHHWARLVLRWDDNEAVTRFSGKVAISHEEGVTVLTIEDQRGDIRCVLNQHSLGAGELSVEEIRTTDGYEIDVVCVSLHNLVPVWAGEEGEE